MRPLLSIIIANYNYGRFLDEAIQSVLSQSCQDFEIIIIDGGSTDNSVVIIRKYAEEKVKVRGLGLQRNSKISYWVSEKDKGQSDAFNKGFAKASGRFLTWLNADDVMLPGAIEKLKIAAEKHPDCEWFVGGSLWLDPEMRVIKCNPGRGFSELRYRCGHVSTWGPSSFFTRTMLEEVRGVDVRFEYLMDAHLWLKFAKAGYRYRPFAKYAYGLRLHPGAKMSGHNFSKSPMSDPHRPKWAKLKQESAWIDEEFNPKRFTRFRRMVSANLVAGMAGAVETFRFKNRQYTLLFRL